MGAYFTINYKPEIHTYKIICRLRLNCPITQGARVVHNGDTLKRSRKTPVFKFKASMCYPLVFTTIKIRYPYTGNGRCETPENILGVNIEVCELSKYH